MRSALWRILTLTFLVGLFGLSGHALIPFHTGQACAATGYRPSGASHQAQTVSYLTYTHGPHSARPDDDSKPPNG